MALTQLWHRAYYQLQPAAFIHQTTLWLLTKFVIWNRPQHQWTSSHQKICLFGEQKSSFRQSFQSAANHLCCVINTAPMLAPQLNQLNAHPPNEELKAKAAAYRRQRLKTTLDAPPIDRCSSNFLHPMPSDKLVGARPLPAYRMPPVHRPEPMAFESSPDAVGTIYDWNLKLISKNF